MPVPVFRRPHVWSAVRAAVVLLLALAPTVGRAADPKPTAPKPAETALGKVPADVDFYHAFLRMGETVETIGRTRAWAQLWSEPEVQELWKKAKAAYTAEDGPGAMVRQFFAAPANAALPELVADALSHEVFIYGGAGTGDLLALMQEVGGVARFAPAIQKLAGADPADPAAARIRLVLQSLAEKPERVKVPDLVIGFKVSDPVAVAAQLKRVDPLLAGGLMGTPLAGRVERTKVGGDEFLVVKLDGSLVPWDMVELDKYEEKPGEFAPLLKHLKGLKATVAVGVRQGYLLIAVSESADRLTKFGGPGPKLVGRPELKPLEKVAGRPLTAVGYTSQVLRQAVGTSPEDITGWAELAKTLLGKADLVEADQKAIEKDIDALAKSITGSLTKAGASANFSIRTPRGWETFDYDYTDAGPTDTRPLTLLNHLGGDPLLAAVWRSGTTVEDYRALVKWLTIFAKHAETIAVAKAPGAEDVVKTVRSEVYPLLKELSGVTEKLWLPALADGQQAIVLDAKWASKRWHAVLPEADRELPLPELGVIVGVSDPVKLGQALEGYRVVLNKMLAKAHELDPTGQVPKFEIPKPRVEEKGGRKFAYYPIPEEWGIDRQFRPTGGVAGKVAALTLSREHTERLLTEIPLQTGMAPFADAARPLESAFYLNWAGTVEAAGPWVGYLIHKAAAAEGLKQAEHLAVKVMGLLKLFRGYGSATYREGKATVTHSEAVFGDIEPAPAK